MNLADALTDLGKTADAEKSKEMARYHKIDRAYLGVANPTIDSCTKEWRKSLELGPRLTLCAELWETNIHEARVAAAKLLTQARIRPDDSGAWSLIQSWVPDFDAWAIADHVSIAGQKRLTWDPSRLDDIEPWTRSEHMWTRRAALVMTLPWTKNRFPKSDELAQRERILEWAAGYVEDTEWFIQKAVAWWLRDLSKRDPERTRAFLEAHGKYMKPFARKEAARLLP
ncbi:MAG: DNA alkylation repair protein [Boseongicola sp.]|nr:DNA alkylation repair protein [Boseongicola sp.]